MFKSKTVDPDSFYLDQRRAHAFIQKFPSSKPTKNSSSNKILRNCWLTQSKNGPKWGQKSSFSELGKNGSGVKGQMPTKKNPWTSVQKYSLLSLVSLWNTLLLCKWELITYLMRSAGQTRSKAGGKAAPSHAFRWGVQHTTYVFSRPM